MISDEDALLISRLLDDDLSADEAIDIKQRLLQEPELREVYNALQSDHALLGEMIRKVDEEPPPESLTALLEGQPQPRAGAFIRVGIAAAILLAVFGTTVLLNQPGKPTLVDILNDMPSGQRTQSDDGTIEVIATFRTETSICREFQTETSRGVACRTSGTWETVITEPHSAPNRDFTPASSNSPVQAFVMDNIQGQPLSPAQEAELLKDW